MSKFRLHPLHTLQRHSDVMRDLGVVGYHEWLASERCTGRTTALAHQYIVQAMQSPGAVTDMHDHFDTTAGHHNLALTVEHIIKKLEYRGFAVTRSPSRAGVFSIKFGG